MAGTGPAPKENDQRRRANVPARGEWIDLPLEPREVPPLPDGDWHPNAARSWAAWWSDPAASQWTDADSDAVHALLALADEFWRGKVTVAPEMRLRAGELGLTQKGKRDLRWRVPVEESAAPKAAVPASDRRQRLRVV